ncbi:uncharacterized protein LOC133907140 [Phragmites australis]|uniref:uncharacterized protein LOC133907140 n=1 Tax=Phragmites australis TaxID=29695 RepID=UPI002D7813FC|nr:uncharacterized protein LOC133907140 [Phragmites australis]
MTTACLLLPARTLYQTENDSVNGFWLLFSSVPNFNSNKIYRAAKYLANDFWDPNHAKATYPVKPTTPLHPCIRSSWSLRWKSNDGAALNDLSVVSPARAHARVVTPSASNGAAPTTVPVTSAFLPFAKDKAVAEGAVAAALPELALAPAEKDAVTSAIEVDWKPYLDAGSNNGVLGSQRGVQNGVKPASTASEGQAAPFPPQTNRKAQRCWSRELQCPPNPQRCPRYACIYYSHTWKSSLNYLEKNTRCMHYCELKTNKNLFVLCKSGDPEADP